MDEEDEILDDEIADSGKVEMPEFFLPYDGESDIWEVIVKYNSNIKVVEQPLNAIVEILDFQFAIVTLPKENINKLIDYSEVEFIERPKKISINSADSLRASCITSVLNDPSIDLDGRGVLIAILDSGIDYAHPEFLNEDGTTRIVRLWDQTISGNPPQGFSIGYEFTKEDINEALSLGNINERRRVVPSVDHLGHGTSITSIAAGSISGAATKSELVIVKIGRNINSPTARTTELMRGISYAVNIARNLNMPMAINISYGTNDGSHDSFSLFEWFIDNISLSWQLSVVVATGNEGDTGKHYSATIEQGQTIDMEYSISNDLSNIGINLWKNFVDFFTFEIIAPDGTSSGTIRFSNDIRRYIFHNCTLYVSFGQPSYLHSSQEIYFYFESNKNTYIDKGIWSIRIIGDSIVYGTFNAWLPISEISGKTYFLEANNNISLTVPSTCLHVISVGGYNSYLNTSASFSGRGNLRISGFNKPDLVAPAVSIDSALPGGGYSPQTGTSFAVPHVVGAAALLLQWGIVDNNDQFLYGQKIKAYLRLGAKHIDDIAYPNTQWGYGSLCLSQTLNYLNQMNRNNQTTLTKAPLASFNMQNIETKNNTNKISIQEANNENIENNNFNLEFDTNGNNIFTNENYISNFEDKIDVVAIMNNELKKYIENRKNIYVKLLLDRYAIITMPESELSSFEDNKNLAVIQEYTKCMGLMGRESLEATDILNVQNQPYLNLRGRGTLVAIIDTGIDYTKPAFVYEDNTTKIVAIWDQSINGIPPEGFLYGTEYTKEDINRALTSDNPIDIVNHRDEVGHGTFLAAVSCGREESGTDNIGAAPDAELIIVKLKEANKITKDRTAIHESIQNVYTSSDLMQAVEYVRNISLKLRKPISVCIGLGTNEGSHDGLGIFETYLNEVCRKNGIIISCAMGNEGRIRRHTKHTLLRTGDYKDVEIRVGEDEKGFSVFIYATEPDRLSISITSPTGEFIGTLPTRDGNFFETSLVFEKSIVGVRYNFESEKNLTEQIFLRIKNPTSGLWVIRVNGDVVVDGRFHMWLPISNFISADTYFLESIADYSLTMPASATGLISVGAYNSNNDTLYVGSGRGPNRVDAQKPVIVAPGVNVYYGNIVMSGTSISTAIVAGACALLLQWGIVENYEPIFNTTRAKAYIIEGAIRRGILDYPNTQWGYGILNLMSTFNALRIK
ncbi:MAG: S8 family serine peptidase [Defluviitaleaceae bacterium]|nr:S8 family serine peptidase [Defluviitaleaceae bacterium]